MQSGRYDHRARGTAAAASQHALELDEHFWYWQSIAREVIGHGTQVAAWIGSLSFLQPLAATKKTACFECNDIRM